MASHRVDPEVWAQMPRTERRRWLLAETKRMFRTLVREQSPDLLVPPEGIASSKWEQVVIESLTEGFVKELYDAFDTMCLEHQQAFASGGDAAGQDLHRRILVRKIKDEVMRRMQGI